MTRKYKVIVLIDQLISGGVQKTAIEEVINLRKMGYNASLMVLTRKGFNKKNKEFVKNIPFEFLPDRYPKILRFNFKIPYFKFLSIAHILSPFTAPLYVRKDETDIILSHGTTTSFTALSLFYFKNIPYFTIVYDPMLYILDKVYSKNPLKYFFPLIRPFCAFLEEKIVSKSSACFVISNVHSQYIKSRYKVKPTILYLGINVPKNIPKISGNKILLLGRWEKEKNIKLVLDIAKKIPSSQFIIAGSWTNHEDLNEFKNEIKSSHLSTRIELMTHFSENKLYKIIEKSRFWIHPNLEAFSLSALEVASFGLPIIIPANSGVTELFKSGKHGFFPKAGDQEGFAKAVKYLHDNPQKASQMGTQAAKIARQYTWRRHSEIISNYLNNFFQKK